MGRRGNLLNFAEKVKRHVRRNGHRLVGPVAGVIAFWGFWTFRGYRLPSTVTRDTVREAGLAV